MIETAIKMSWVIMVLLSMVLGGLLFYKWKASQETVSTTVEKFPLVLSQEEKKLMGSWVEPIPENENEYHGFTLLSDGTARSINTGELLYKTWQIRGDELSLIVESIGEGLSSEDMETYIFEQISENTLLLKIGKSVFPYKRVH
ncbi:lipocalin family protein [bacterium]|nr:lipocalin family protein [bacterium]MBU1957203.1 lipocalin family protein [bacterium]